MDDARFQSFQRRQRLSRSVERVEYVEGRSLVIGDDPRQNNAPRKIGREQYGAKERMGFLRLCYTGDRSILGRLADGVAEPLE